MGDLQLFEDGGVVFPVGADDDMGFKADGRADEGFDFEAGGCADFFYGCPAPADDHWLVRLFFANDFTRNIGAICGFVKVGCNDGDAVWNFVAKVDD